MTPIDYTTADKTTVRNLAKRPAARLRKLARPGPVTIHNALAGTTVVVQPEHDGGPTMSKPPVLTKFWTPERLREDGERPNVSAKAVPIESDDALLPTGGYADVINAMVSE